VYLVAVDTVAHIQFKRPFGCGLIEVTKMSQNAGGKIVKNISIGLFCHDLWITLQFGTESMCIIPRYSGKGNPGRIQVIWS